MNNSMKKEESDSGGGPTPQLVLTTTTPPPPPRVEISGSSTTTPITNTSTSPSSSNTSEVCPVEVNKIESKILRTPNRSPRTVQDTLPEEDFEGNGNGNGDHDRGSLSIGQVIGNRSSSITGRSGSAGTIEPGFPSGSGHIVQQGGVGKRASFHHPHGKKLTRRSSFLVDTACHSSYAQHMNVFPKPMEPAPQPVIVPTRRCSLTLPYPNLYGSWQAAGASVPTEGQPRRVPPPLLKRRSVAHFDMSRVANSISECEVDLNFRKRLSDAVHPVRSDENLKKSQENVVLSTSSTTGSVAQLISTQVKKQNDQVGTSDGDGGASGSGSCSRKILAENEDLSERVRGGDMEINVDLDIDLEDEIEGVCDDEEPYMLHVQLQKVPMKDFGSEVRATLDVAHFLNQAVLLLDVTETSLEGVVDLMLNKLFLNADEQHSTIDEIKSSLFAHDSVHLLARTIQGITGSEGVSFDYDQSWICAICNLPSLQRRHVAICRLKHPANFGRTSHEVRLFIVVLCPSKEKGTKNALETGRTFATILSDIDFRQTLLEAHTEEEFKRVILKQAQLLSQLQSKPEFVPNHVEPEYECKKRSWFHFGTGIREDFQRRFLSTVQRDDRKPMSIYLSDYHDGIIGYKTVQKTISTTFFLYFACILPAIAFGVLNDHTTGGIIDVRKVIVGQTLGELCFVVLSGQPLNIVLTTAPLCLFVKILFALSVEFNVNFQALYFCVGLWSSLFTCLYALFDVSRLMRWSTRSTEEIFALFISIAFCVDAFRDTLKNFNENYSSPACTIEKNISSLLIGAVINASETLDTITLGSVWTDDTGLNTTTVEALAGCQRDSSLLFLLLMLGTLWVGVSLYNFNKTPYLQAGKREALADYSLPVAVILLSFIGSFVFQDVSLERFKYDETNDLFKVADLNLLTWNWILCSVGLGFSLSLLIFMDQNITSAMVNNPCNKLKKGPAYHWDLLIVAFINSFLSMFTMPWVHAALPHSPLHMRSLADVEERVDQGHVYEIIVRVRETRLTGIFSHMLIGLSIFLLPYPLGYIPIAVLDGLFLYMAVTALNGNQMFERITLLFMEQAAYPPSSYIRRVPQRKIHQFTGFQVLQLAGMCVVGFVPWPYVKMAFPITILLLLPIRHKVVPRIIEQKFLDALDGEHQ